MKFVSQHVLRFVALLAGAAAPGAGVTADAQHGYAAERLRMLDEIDLQTRESRLETGRVVLAERVRQAIARVPRHAFVPANEKGNAYQNRPLAIGHGQTISQPFIVALMTDIMDVKPTDKVLEIGTGSGYQAAVLAELAAEVYTVEIVEPLARQAAETLVRLGYRNVKTRIGDGYQGWAEHALYDSIVVTAAPRSVPQPLIDQLKPGGRLVVPVGAQSGGQELLVLEKQPGGAVVRRTVLAVRFVPLVDQKGKPQ